jgi:polyhydroxyalkanoate synthesis regulator phasin
MLDELRRVALVTSGVAELTRNRAEQIVRDLVRSGDVRRDKASSTVKELLTFAKENRREVLVMLRDEVRSQVESLGVATKRDLDRLERRLERLENRSERGQAATSEARSKTTAKKTTARKKSTPKKTTAKKTTAKKTTARKKSTAKKTTARKKSTAKKTTARKGATAPRTRGPVSEAAVDNAGGPGGSDAS